MRGEEVERRGVESRGEVERKREEGIGRKRSERREESTVHVAPVL